MHPTTSGATILFVGNIGNFTTTDPARLFLNFATEPKKALELMPNDGERRSIKVTNWLHLNRLVPMFNAADKETRRANPVFVKQLKAWQPTAEKLTELCVKDDAVWRNRWRIEIKRWFVRVTRTYSRSP